MEKFYQYLNNKLINDFQFNENDLNQQYEMWIETRGDNIVSKSDFYWSCLNLSMTHYAKNSESLEEMYKVHREINLLMFEFLLKENRKVTDIQKQLNRIDILKAELQNIELDVVIITNGGCEYSKQFDGVKISLETALKDFPLDYNKCIREGGCICCVGFEAKRDNNGRVVKKVVKK